MVEQMFQQQLHMLLVAAVVLVALVEMEADLLLLVERVVQVQHLLFQEHQ
jgi:hypothetical protein